MEPPGGRDSRFNLGYSMNLLSGETAPEIYGNPSLGRPSTSLQQLSPRHTMVSSACGGRGLKSDMYDERGMSSQGMGLEACGVNDISEDTYSSLQSKKSPPSNGKKTKGRVKIKMEYIENKLRRYTTFSKRKTGIMKKAYELSTLTGTQVMLLVASETGHVYTFATRKLQPMITSEAGKALIQTCLNSPDPPAGSAGGDQRMSATGFEETELTYNISDEDSKDVEDVTPGLYSNTSDEEDEGVEETPDSQGLHPSPMAKEPDCSNDIIPEPNAAKRPKPNDNANTVNNNAINNNNTIIDKASQTLHQPMSLPSFVQTSDSFNNNVKNSKSNVHSPITLVPPTSSEPTGSVSLVPPAVTTAAQVQAVPLLLQTPGGVSYATTPDGMFVGIIQGPHLGQPQLVAIPMAAMTTTAGHNILSKTDSNTFC